MGFAWTAVFVGLWSSLLMAEPMSAEQMERVLQPARTLNDYIQLVTAPDERAYLLKLKRNHILDEVKRPNFKTDRKKNILVVSGEWGKLAFDFSHISENYMVINKKRIPRKSFYTFEDFKAVDVSAFSFFINEAKADESDNQGGFWSTLLSWLGMNDDSKTIIRDYGLIQKFECQGDNPVKLVYGSDNKFLEFKYSKLGNVSAITVGGSGTPRCTFRFREDGTKYETKELTTAGEWCALESNSNAKDYSYNEVIGNAFTRSETELPFTTLSNCCKDDSCKSKIQAEIKRNDRAYDEPVKSGGVTAIPETAPSGHR